MRLTGGEWGGQTLAAPKGQETRPTGDAHREALFNIFVHSLAHEMHVVLDLFSGSGALFFEALSRGASTVIATESSREAQKCILDNAKRFSVQDRMSLIKNPKVEAWADLVEERLRMSESRIDTVFCDPPYGKLFVSRLVKSGIFQRSIWAEEAVLYIEMGKKEVRPEISHWKIHKERAKGASLQLFYVYSP